MLWLLLLLAGAFAAWFALCYFRYRRRVAAMRAQGFHVVDSFMGFNVLSGFVDQCVLDKTPSSVAAVLSSVLSNHALHARVTNVFLEKPERSLIALVSSARVTIFTNNYDVAVGAMQGDTIDKQTETYAILECFGGPNIVTTRGNEWKRHRQVCTVAFTKSSLKLVRLSTVKNVTTLLEHWRAQNAGSRELVVQLGGHDDLMRLTLSVFGESIFGRPMDVFKGRDENELSTFCDSFLVANDSLILWLVTPEWVYTVLPIAKLQLIKRAFDNVRQNVMALLDEGAVDESKTDLLSLLARAGRKFNPLTHRESLANVWMFSLAAMETSAHTLSWMLCRLAFHTNVQERLYEEAKGFVGKFVDVTPDTAPYIYAVIHETLRLHPAVNVLPQCVRETTEVAGRTMEKGWGLYVHVEALHLNPAYFADPFEFRPERFLDRNSSAYSTFIAFSLGPRQCIGKQLALTEMAIVIAMIVSAFRVAPLRAKDTCLRWRSVLTREFVEPLPFQFVAREQL